MPRKRVTRVSQKRKPSKASVTSDNDEENLNPGNASRKKLETYLKDFDARVERKLIHFEQMRSSLFRQVEVFHNTEISRLGKEVMKMTIGEYADLICNNDKETEEMEESEPDRLEALDVYPDCSMSVSTLVNSIKHRRFQPSAQKKPFTPAGRTLSKCGWGNTPLVTPKFDPRLPITPAHTRTAKPGELLMSLDGSPVHNANDNYSMTIKKGGHTRKNTLTVNIDLPGESNLDFLPEQEKLSAVIKVLKQAMKKDQGQ